MSIGIKKKHVGSSKLQFNKSLSSICCFNIIFTILFFFLLSLIKDELLLEKRNNCEVKVTDEIIWYSVYMKYLDYKKKCFEC